MTDEVAWQITLTEEDLQLAAAAALELLRIRARLADRYTGPDERRSVGLRLDPKTAQVFYVIGQTLDPYGDDPALPDELRQTGREFFAVDPQERVAVHFQDLPKSTRAALAEKRRVADAEGWRRITGGR